MSRIAALPTRYDPIPVESRWYAHWLERGYFGSKPAPGKKPYTIVIPPPNVTGALHMGHALNNTLQDILIRWRRMQGYEALWIPGTDHAGVATQSVVEKQIFAKEKKTRHDLGREELLRRIWAWKDTYGERILLQLRKLGCSCDWSRTRFTMDEGLSRAVRIVFTKLYREGLIYRGRYLVNWCPALRTALSDDEVDHKEVDGRLWYFRYPVLGEPGRFVTIATTRPETMLGDTAVAVNPGDARYRSLIGKKLLLPLMEREIPVVADAEVDPQFGTGAVKVTPAHDPLDFQIGQRHGLEQVNIIEEDGRINAAGGRFAGLDRFKAREEVVRAMAAAGLLEKETPHRHSVGHCYRTGDVIEPYLSLQWFVKMKPLAEKAIEATRLGRVRFHPERYTDYYLSWLENVRDWCISRQIWWGHRIPVWYAPDGAAISAEDEAAARAAARERFGKDLPLRQDEDVLDTWFSSALWPFSTLGWPDETEDLAYYFPTSTLVTDRGIIFFWVARMVMMALAIRGREPFSDVYIHGTIQDKEGRKMSKSLGNGIDPVALIEGGVDDNTGTRYPHAFGADAVRYSLTTISVEGQDLKLWPERFEAGSGFANKFWNAGRFTLMQLERGAGEPFQALDGAALRLEDRWILSRLHRAIQETTASLEGFRYCSAAQRARDFVWNEFCDWYVEAAKARFADPGSADARVARQILGHVFDAALRLLHPICPFITEELWHLLAETLPDRGLFRSQSAPEAVMAAAWPLADASLFDDEAEARFAAIQAVVQSVRKLRQERNLGRKDAPRVLIACASEAARERLAAEAGLIRERSSTDVLEIGVGIARPPNAASELLAGIGEVFLPLPETDRRQEIESLRKERAGVAGYIERESKKLSNRDFTARAPAAVIESTRLRLAEAEAKLGAIDQKLRELSAR
jgi:valyl-tRNA synthetase